MNLNLGLTLKNVTLHVAQIGIIGGTGIDDPDILSERNEKDVTTPFGKVQKYCPF